MVGSNVHWQLDDRRPTDEYRIELATNGGNCKPPEKARKVAVTYKERGATKVTFSAEGTGSSTGTFMTHLRATGAMSHPTGPGATSKLTRGRHGKGFISAVAFDGAPPCSFQQGQFDHLDLK
jgi:hypothetical protein